MSGFSEGGVTRRPKGRPGGGQFTGHKHDEPEDELTGEFPDEPRPVTSLGREVAEVRAALGMAPPAAGEGNGTPRDAAAGYQEQREWLKGKPLTEARHALETRRATLEPGEYNDAGTQATRDYIEELEENDERPVTDLTALEGKTLRGLPVSRLIAASRRLGAGPGDGFRETGPDQRREIVRQIGDQPFGNLAAISGHRVIPLPDGVELPVSNGYSVKVRLAGNDTYTVQRVFTRAGKEVVKGERTDVYCEDVGQAAYYASCFRSHSPEEWVNEL